MCRLTGLWYNHQHPEAEHQSFQDRVQVQDHPVLLALLQQVNHLPQTELLKLLQRKEAVHQRVHRILLHQLVNQPGEGNEIYKMTWLTCPIFYDRCSFYLFIN